MKHVHAMNIGTAYDALNGASLGDIRYEDSKVYKMIQYNIGAGSVAGISGQVCYYFATSKAVAAGTGYGSNIVTMDETDGLFGAGILQVAMTASQYGWILIKGPFTSTLALGGSAGDGHPLTTSTTDGELTKAVEADSAGVYKNICGIADDASAKLCCANFPF